MEVGEKRLMPSAIGCAIVEADLPFEQVEEETTKVVSVVLGAGMNDKATLLETSDFLYSRYYKLDGYIDYFYSSLTPSTGYISMFDIQPYNGGTCCGYPGGSSRGVGTGDSAREAVERLPGASAVSEDPSSITWAT